MKRLIVLSAAFAAALALALPFVGGGIASSSTAAMTSISTPAESTTTTVVTGEVAEASPAAAAGVVATIQQPAAPASSTNSAAPDSSSATSAGAQVATTQSAPVSDERSILKDTDPTATPKPVAPASPAASSGTPDDRLQSLEAQGLSCSPGTASVGSAPSAVSALGVNGTTTADMQAFAAQFNAIRAANCLPPVTKFIYDSCMEARLFWMAESPSPNPLDAWGHMGSVRSDGVPSVGCDGNLAGGSNNTGATVATKWWDSLAHRNSLYRPGSSVSGVCIAFAMTHGGIDEPVSFVRAAARWVTC
jgi:uncharacterized protein YkwD